MSKLLEALERIGKVSNCSGAVDDPGHVCSGHCACCGQMKCWNPNCCGRIAREALAAHRASSLADDAELVSKATDAINAICDDDTSVSAIAKVVLGIASEHLRGQR